VRVYARLLTERSNRLFDHDRVLVNRDFSIAESLFEKAVAESFSKWFFKFFVKSVERIGRFIFALAKKEFLVLIGMYFSHRSNLLKGLILLYPEV
jgi:hypothetical protein